MADDEKLIKAPPSLTMHAQFIKDLSFENPRASEIFTKQTGQPDVEVSVNVGANALDNEKYEIILNLNAKAKVETEPLYNVNHRNADLVKPAIPHIIGKQPVKSGQNR